MKDDDVIFYSYKLEKEFCRGDYRFREENVKEILEEIYNKGYTQCEEDMANNDRYSLRDEAKL